MTESKMTVFGIYASQVRAEQSIDSLTKSDLPISAISALAHDPLGTTYMESDSPQMGSGYMASGAGTGVMPGGTFGLLAGIANISIPGVWPVLAAGPIVGALSGIGIGAVVGGLAGALTGLGIPETIANRYEGRIREGGVLLSVRCDTCEEINQAKEIMQGGWWRRYYVNRRVARQLSKSCLSHRLRGQSLALMRKVPSIYSCSQHHMRMARSVNLKIKLFKEIHHSIPDNLNLGASDAN